MPHLRTYLRGHPGKRLRNHGIQTAARPWLPPNTNSRDRPSRPRESQLGSRHRGDVGAYGIADGARLHLGTEAPRKGFQHLAGQTRQPTIGQTGNGILLVNQQRNAQQPRGNAAGSAYIAAGAENRTRLHSAQHSHGLRHGFDDPQGREQPSLQTLAREFRRRATHSMGKPCAGTNLDSMLPGTPSHTTGTPRSRSTLATANAGNT